jgi:hypothetical protein
MKRLRTHACSQDIHTRNCTRYESLRCSSMHAHMSTYVCANVRTCTCIGEQRNDAYRVKGPGQPGLPRLGAAQLWQSLDAQLGQPTPSLLYRSTEAYPK